MSASFGSAPAGRRVATVAVVVADYDEAIAWYTQKLGFELSRMSTSATASAGWWSRRQTAAHACFWRRRQTTNSARASATRPAAACFSSSKPTISPATMQLMTERGVEFREAPRHEAYGTVAVFADLYGNLWDLIEPRG